MLDQKESFVLHPTLFSTVRPLTTLLTVFATPSLTVKSIKQCAINSVGLDCVWTLSSSSSFIFLTMSVYLSIPSEAALASAELVAQDLLKRFGIEDVTIRSSSAPMDRLLNITDPVAVPRTALWVFWSGSSMVTAGMLQEESPYPVLEVDSSADPKEISWVIAKWYSLGNIHVAEKIRKIAKSRRQAKLVEDAQLQTKSWKYHQAIAKCFDEGSQVTGSGIDGAIPGKVRDRIDLNDKLLALVTTDRQSGFDRMLGLVPFKGAVLNLTSAFWFDKTKHIIPNHVVSIPHPYVTISKKCKPFPIEFVVRYVLYSHVQFCL